MISRENLSRITLFTILMVLLVAPATAATDTIFDGTVTLTPDATFDVVAYNSAVTYTVSETTPLGALRATGLSYGVTDKNYASSGALLLDNVGTYLRDKTNKIYWYAYVNDVYKDGFDNPAGGLNLIELTDGDKVEYYYAPGISDPTDLATVKAAAIAAVKIQIGPTMDVLYEGTVTLTPDATFDVVAYNSAVTYTVSETTPLGALRATGLSYGVTDKNYASSGALLLDNVGTYLRDKTNKIYWYAYVNDVYKDGFGNPAGGLNLIELTDGDKVEYYYAPGISDPTDLATVKAAAIAAVKTVASTGVTPTDWSIVLAGAKTQTVTKAYFEDGLACSESGHQVFWTDGDNTWGGVPLWVLVGMVDDNPDMGPLHFNFNDTIATKNYQVNVIGSDGTTATLDSARIARNNNIIVANTLNDAPLPLTTPAGKPSWPLHLRGSDVLTGEQIGDIARIELTGLPEPSEGWTLKLIGDVTDIITQEEFEAAIAHGHTASYTETVTGAVYSGVPLWYLVGAVDDYETSDHWTFNDARAATNYAIEVRDLDSESTPPDPYTVTFFSDVIAQNGDYIIADTKNGAKLPDGEYPLRLVGTPVEGKTPGKLGGKAVGEIDEIAIPSMVTPDPASGSYNLILKGKISDVLSQTEIEDGLACPESGHLVTWTQQIKDTASGDVIETHTWSGIPLWFLGGWVDDRKPHDFNTAQATAGYMIVVKAKDGFSKSFSITDVAFSDDYIVATMKDGEPLDSGWPLQLVGDPLTKIEDGKSGLLGGKSVKNIAEIELTEFGNLPAEAPKLHIVKYDSDGITILKEVTIDYHFMEDNLEVIGDGTTHYKYQGLTLDPLDLWDPTETKGMNPPKVDNAIKGTKIRDLVDLVGGMGTGTDVIFIASDGYETKLGYSNIYTNPYVQSQQGDAVLAWYADGEYVPEYGAGMRTFFTPADHVFGQWNMHEALDVKYWHFNTQGGVEYPSAAGTSNQNVVEIKVYSSPETDWELELDGTSIGGKSILISKSYFEQALACQFDSNHKVTYSDSKGRVWEGMPLWFLAGFVDDEDQHSDTAFNDALAQDGYRIIVTGSDGSSAEIDSREIIRNSDYIVANSLNGVHIAADDENWPLRLTGADVMGTTSIKGIVKIQLVPNETPAPEFPTPAFPVLVITVLAFIILGSRRKF